MSLSNYIIKVNKRYNSGLSGEHAYRTDLENLLREMVSGIEVTNEPEKVTACGNPDFVITKGEIPIGYIEAKDVGADLNSKAFREQFDRYRSALDNLILTDYLHFQFIEHGKPVHQIRIGEIDGKSVKALEKNFAQFANLIRNFCTFTGQTVTSPAKLAEMMAAKARLLQNILERVITSDEKTQENTSLRDQYATFKRNLIHDLSPKEFADIYAQTLAYGMFAARVHDTDLNDFSRQKAAELVPKSNPFLRKLFQNVAGYDIDCRIKSTVDNLADVFRAADVEQLLKNFGKNTQTDPIIHFYETFLAEYDPRLRKARGVWYTPESVVKFIVRAVDDILKTEFGLAQGLADTSKTKICIPEQGSGNGRKIEKEVHRVQILDPACGTGTFLAEVLHHVYENHFRNMQGAWPGYVEDHMIPRLNGFEILMASYAMAHLKLDMLLRETGHVSEKDRRFHIYLTNSLEEHHPDTGTLFASWLSAEANEANHIKRDAPIMVVLGNPPYSGESANKGRWIEKLMEDYKKEPGGKEKLKEKNSKWINDDYVKFLRYGQHFIEKNGEGILAFINPHGYLDNPTFRGMRWNLLKTYDKIYTVDLHGNSKKKEVCPDGGKDENVFDIMQGVSINIFVKTGKKKEDEPGRVFHFDLYGKREEKYAFLRKNHIKQIAFTKLPNAKPDYFFVQKNFDLRKIYSRGFSVSELFTVNGTGIVTKRDSLCIGDSADYSYNAALDILQLPKQEFYRKYNLPEDVRDWQYEWAVKDIQDHKLNISHVKKINYRPFDIRYIYYTGRSRGFMGWPVLKIMQHFLNGENTGLIFKRGDVEEKASPVFVSKYITDFRSWSRPGMQGGDYMAPLYLYPEINGQQNIDERQERIPNLNMKITAQIAKGIDFTFTPEKEKSRNTFAPIDILDYIYAVLHSQNYRETYREFLKIDFPRVPYPDDTKTFWKLVKFGSELRTLHLLENPKAGQFITAYPQPGDNIITRCVGKKDFEITDRKKQTGRVWISDTQYFEGVPIIAWEFYIGGYQPAQKWLKDRKGRKLDFADILHYQKIISALAETDNIMKKIDLIWKPK
ncbi:MAG: type ISP restriction/modification enzyme [Desulfococcaceae bacterium]